MTVLALKAKGLNTFYGKSHILHDVSLEVCEGEIVALLGRNGAGKTTTLRSLVGLTPARQGVVRIFGNTTTDWPPYSVAALGVGYVPEGRRIFPNLSVEENLWVPLERAAHGPSSAFTNSFRAWRSAKQIRAGNFQGASRKCYLLLARSY